MQPFVYESKEFTDELQNNRHAAGEVEFLRSIARLGMHVVEVGANRGVTAIALAKKIGKAGRLYAFEPVAEYYTQLKENLSANGVDNVSAYNLALSDRRGRIRLYKRGEGTGITSSDDAEQLWVGAATIADFLAEQKTERIDLLNLDCEGSELLVLQGAKPILGQQAPQIFCEIHHPFLEQLGQSADDIVRFLQELAYDVRPLKVEELNAETSFESCSHIYARKQPEKGVSGR